MAQAQKSLAAYAEIAIRFVEVDLAISADLAAKDDIYAYDAHLLTCALQHRAPLLTLDVVLSLTATRLALLSSRSPHEKFTYSEARAATPWRLLC